MPVSKNCKPVPLVRDWLDGVDCAPGEVVLCENVRFNKGDSFDYTDSSDDDKSTVVAIKAIYKF